MATLIYVDKENDAPVAVKDRVRLPSASTKVFTERSQTQGPAGKVFNAASGPAPRKGLGNVKVNLGKAAAPTKQTKKSKVQPTSKSTGDQPNEEKYPEIEKFFPYDPLDFEMFDVPEEHKLSHLCLAGVPLLMLENKRFERHLNLQSSPMKTSPFTWTSDVLDSSFLSSLDEVTIDLPPLWED